MTSQDQLIASAEHADRTTTLPNSYICSNCSAHISAQTGANRSYSRISFSTIYGSIVSDNHSIFPTVMSVYENDTLNKVLKGAPAFLGGHGTENSPIVTTIFVKCPKCTHITITASLDFGEDSETVNVPIYPRYTSTSFGKDVLPFEIFQDFDEANGIVNISPRASATLARRCVQSMIRHKFGTSGNLYSEIKTISDQISSEELSVLHNIRQLGNIGAHPEENASSDIVVDITVEEAHTLLRCTEYFVKKWFIDPASQTELFNQLGIINNQKQTERRTDK